MDKDSDARLDRFVGVFFPGGHGPIVDVMQDPDAGEVLRYFHGANKPTAAICHGPISVLAAHGVWRNHSPNDVTGSVRCRDVSTAFFPATCTGMLHSFLCSLLCLLRLDTYLSTP